MGEVDDRRRQREELLVALYEVADVGRTATVGQVADAAGVSLDVAQDGLDYLNDQGFGRQRTAGGAAGRVELTALGVDAARSLLARRATGPIDDVVPAPLVAGLEPVVASLRHAMKEMDEGDDQAEVVANIETIEAQQRSPRPDRSIIERALCRVKHIACADGHGVTGNAGNQALQSAAAHGLRLIGR